MTDRQAPAAELIIAVHSSDRPLRRAVESVLAAATPGRVLATVVCHNIDPAPLHDALAGLPAEQVRVLALADGIRSPAGPFNYGLEHAVARFVGIMGSDDTLEVGAVDAWLATAEGAGAAVVMAPLRLRGGRRILTPRARVLRGMLVAPVRDRLAYRTAPLGLFRRDLLAKHGLALTPGLRTGEDLEFGLKLWFSGERIAYPAQGPAYEVGNDVAERVTSAVLPLAEQFRDVRSLVAGTWFAALPERKRAAVAVKILRGHVISAAVRRGSDFSWPAADRRELNHVIELVTGLAPAAPKVLSAPDERLLLELRDAGSAEAVKESLRRREAANALRRSLTLRWQDNFRVEAPLRSNLNSLLAAGTDTVLSALPPAARRRESSPQRRKDAA
ncbi:glycosyltransferase [Crystallibacter degradans]|uniref:glycosyltransferase n=1 Tax=Crystallibacter degradans TaxID=2726743 RepID=UPI001475D9C3|nr:glycosyltransferase [Arthrobacter sp. SF27]NMR29927.1 glycosyltransferase family 2 protein [Arthrobacter sp. SF27]